MRYVLIRMVALLLAHSLPASAAVLSLTPATQTVTLGDQVRLDVVLGEPGGLIAAYDVTVTFDARALGLAEVAFGTALGGPLESIPATLPGDGSINVAEISLLTDFTGVQDAVADLDLFTLVFDTRTTGLIALDFSAVLVGDDAGQPVPVTALNGATVDVQPVAGVPGASSLWISLAGIFAVALSRRNHSQRGNVRP